MQGWTEAQILSAMVDHFRIIAAKRAREIAKEAEILVRSGFSLSELELLMDHRIKKGIKETQIMPKSVEIK